MKRNIYFKDDDTKIVYGRSVPVAPIRFDRDGKKDGVEPSYGFKMRVMTPWGSPEVCTITPVPGLSGALEFCAQVYKPKSNPYVRFCTFWVDI